MAYKILPPSQFVTVTWAGETAQTEQDTSRAIQSALIQRIDTDTLGSRLTVVSPDGAQGMLSYTVTQSPAAIAALTGIHILLTPTDTTLDAFYANVCVFRGGIIDMTSVPFGGNYRTVYLDFGTVQTLNVSESAASLVAALNAAGGISPAPVQEVTAAGGTQGTATALTGNEGVNFVRIIGGAAGTGVRLPAAIAGTTFVIDEASGSRKNLYPATGETIEGLAANAPLPIDASVNITLVCMVAGTWVENDGFIPTITTSQLNGAAGAAIGVTTQFTSSAINPASPAYSKQGDANTGFGFNSNPDQAVISVAGAPAVTAKDVSGIKVIQIATALDVPVTELEPGAGAVTCDTPNGIVVAGVGPGPIQLNPNNSNLTVVNPTAVDMEIEFQGGATINGAASFMLYAGQSVQLMASSSAVPYTEYRTVGAFRTVRVTLVAGTDNVVDVNMTANCRFSTGMVTPGGGGNGVQYKCVAGVGSFDVTAVDAAGALVNTDVSVVDVTVYYYGA